MTSLNDLKQDRHNANKGTSRGRETLKASLETLGAGRSILVDKDLNIIAGNKTVEAALGVGIQDVVIVETEGDKLVVVKRNDVSIDDRVGKSLAYADNRISEISLDWDVSQLEQDLSQLNLEWLFTDSEIDELLADISLQDNEAMKGDVKSESYLKVLNYEIPLTDYESKLLLTLITRYVDQFGGLYGFVRYYLDVHSEVST